VLHASGRDVLGAPHHRSGRPGSGVKVQHECSVGWQVAPGCRGHRAPGGPARSSRPLHEPDDRGPLRHTL
jgi:hypothetical protein